MSHKQQESPRIGLLLVAYRLRLQKYKSLFIFGFRHCLETNLEGESSNNNLFLHDYYKAKDINMNPSWTDVLQGIGTIASAIISLFGFLFIYWQIRQTNDGIKKQNHASIYNMGFELFKIFIENQELRPYFYENKKLEKNDINFQKVMSLAELHADFF